MAQQCATLPVANPSHVAVATLLETYCSSLCILLCIPCRLHSAAMMQCITHLCLYLYFCIHCPTYTGDALYRPPLVVRAVTTSDGRCHQVHFTTELKRAKEGSWWSAGCKDPNFSSSSSCLGLPCKTEGCDSYRYFRPGGEVVTSQIPRPSQLENQNSGDKWKI